MRKVKHIGYALAVAKVTVAITILPMSLQNDTCRCKTFPGISADLADDWDSPDCLWQIPERYEMFMEKHTQFKTSLFQRGGRGTSRTWTQNSYDIAEKLTKEDGSQYAF